ncbi:piggyBac transposable element-derived protein 4-like [Trichoplusia ni]|uniref:PiggyBac transposable element-derived protein 4-like n=1 Tax=Trichoplusia ni TaxID=7111 RepID=A0A7E5X0N6_TRINI|nr:piggyBac transposable element-derived protein 4-like [Trichoplusia ni]
MDCEEGPSRPKRQRKQLFSIMHDSDIEEVLFSDNSEDDYQPGDEESASESEGEEHPLDIELRSPARQLVSPTAQDQDLQPNSPSVSDTQGQAQLNQPSAVGSTAEWTTTGEMREIYFTKSNEFYGEIAGANPIDYFIFFFTEDFLTMICTETNAQAQRLISRHNQEVSSRRSRDFARISGWKQVTVCELKIFLGLLFHMGTIPLSRLQDYWKKDRLFSIPIFGKQMSRNRFLLILRCLHFTSEEESEDPMFKVRSVIDYFNNKMTECYYPAAQLSLDESMVLWRGRLSFRQFIKNKRHKYGIKLYMLTEPDGLVLKFRVYAGGKDTDVSGKGHAEKVVMELLQGKLNNGHELYMDNFYNSFGLAKKLLDHNTYCTGTLRKDLKENPQEIRKKNIKKGENISMFREGVHVGVWKDKRVVTYITTQYKDRMVPVQNKRGQVTQKPEAISKYNDYMSGVDMQDQLLAYYPCERKTLRWYLKLAIHTFQLLFLNSMKMYNKYSGQRKMSLYDYRMNVINALLPENVPGNRPSNTQTHKIKKATETTSNGRLKRKTCRQCTKNKKRTDSPWYCDTCPDKPGLCVECFENYHSELPL